MLERQQKRTSGRIEWIDFAKGAGILLVMLGHTVYVDRQGSIMRGLVFSFHMPLFFMLSCMTFRCSVSMEELAKKTGRAAKHLLIPVAVVFALTILLSNCHNPGLWRDSGYWERQLYSLVVASGVDEMFYDVQVPALGVPWFFFALFIGRTLFDYLHLRYADNGLAYHCWLVSAVGVLLGRNHYLPLSLDIALAILPFFLVGHWLGSHDVWGKPVRLLVISLAVWLLTLWLEFPRLDNWTYLELACRRYPLYPICYLTAVAGALFICALSVLAMKLGRITAPVVYLGRNSLYLLMIHCLDGFWYRWWGTPGRQLVESGKRIVADLVVFAAFMLLKAAFDRVVKRVKAGRASQPGRIAERRHPNE